MKPYRRRFLAAYAALGPLAATSAVAEVTLVPRAGNRKTRRFLLELREVHGRWLVGFWDSAALAHEHTS